MAEAKRPRLPLTLRASLLALALGLGCLCAFYIVSRDNMREAAREDAIRSADRASGFLVRSIERQMMQAADSGEDPGTAVRGLLDDFREDAAFAVVVRDKKGLATLAAPRDPEDGGKDVASRECMACHKEAEMPARKTGAPSSAVFEDDSGAVAFIRAVPAREGCFTSSCHARERGRNVLGTVGLSFTVPSATDRWIVPLRWSFFEALPALLIGGGFAAWFSQRLARPKAMMEAALAEKSGGAPWRDLDLEKAGEFRDIAESINSIAHSVRRRQHEMDENLSMYQSLFEGVPCLITVQNRDLQLIKYNNLFGEHFGAKPVEHCYKIYKGRDTKCLNCPVEKTFQDGKSHTTEERGFYKDGSPAYWIVQTAPVRNNRGEITAVMEMCLDITERKKLEEKLKKSERTYATIFDNIPVAVFELDAESLQVRNCNRKMSQLYGYCKGEVIGKSFANLFARGGPGLRPEELRIQKKVAQATHVDKEEKEFYVSIDISRTQLNGDDILLAVVTDVTDRIRTEQQVIQSSKMATLGEMAAGVAHELNQPLAVLKMVANYFARKSRRGEIPDRDDLANMTEKIVGNVDRATKIIEHMREFGRKPNLESTEVLINEVLQRACDFFSEQLKIRDIVLKWELEPGQPPVLADPNRLEQVFINLLVNARDAIEDKCSARDCTQGDRVISLRTRSNARHVVAEVTDTGPGIPKDVLGRIFEPFFSTKEVGRGTGLGLSICYDIVTDYEGTIHAFSKPGQGARFVVTLPIADAARAGGTDSAAANILSA